MRAEQKTQQIPGLPASKLKLEGLGARGHQRRVCCALQVQRLHAFAFPLAEVAVAVAGPHPEFLDILLARLHRVRHVPTIRQGFLA